MRLCFLGLSYEGIQRPLGFVHTVGTVPELLPPPPSTRLSTFLEPHNPHFDLDSWCQGPSMPIEAAKDTGVPYVEMILKKNRLSLDVISCLLTRCTWLNIHIVPPHGIVLEIRIAEGFGARWSEDGIKFMGFLEPYVVDGFLKGWKH
ncbi:uncharacterized protein LOC142542258 isoform X2 [Primulina tabacum]|uniref:uncharacterized protein LOC142542258 isoform X2 n=1 Tax=Primulina tabacum TaxID=48773 RepID=UPI003F5A60E0